MHKITDNIVILKLIFEDLSKLTRSLNNSYPVLEFSLHIARFQVSLDESKTQVCLDTVLVELRISKSIIFCSVLLRKQHMVHLVI